jgi:hypothetical protein
MKKHCRSASICGQGLAALDCRTFLSFRDPPASLEASLPVPPRKLRNVAQKHVEKKLKVSETTSQEVSRLG